jgi:hypothetical protein
MYRRIPFKPSAVIGKRVTYRTRGRLGDSINTPGFPGSSTMYGRLGQAEAPAPSAPWYQQITQALAPIATTALSVYQQSRIDRMNRQRLAQGLAPISPEQYRAAVGPTASAEVGISAPTRNLLLYGGLGLAAILILPKLFKR